MTFGGVLAAASVAFDAGASTRLVAVFPPWWSAERALAAASGAGAVSRVGRADFIVAVAADRPDLASELRRRGAWYVADDSRFPVCFSPTKRP